MQLKYNFANLILRKLVLESDFSRSVWLPIQLLLKIESTSCKIAAKREHDCPVCWIGPGEDTGPVCLGLAEQMCSNWAAIGLIGKLKC